MARTKKVMEEEIVTPVNDEFDFDAVMNPPEESEPDCIKDEATIEKNIAKKIIKRIIETECGPKTIEIEE